MSPKDVSDDSVKVGRPDIDKLEAVMEREGEGAQRERESAWY